MRTRCSKTDENKLLLILILFQNAKMKHFQMLDGQNEQFVDVRLGNCDRHFNIFSIFNPAKTSLIHLS